jgi:hypothetical protein
MNKWMMGEDLLGAANEMASAPGAILVLEMLIRESTVAAVKLAW